MCFYRIKRVLMVLNDMDDLIAGFTQSIPKSGYSIQSLDSIDLKHGNEEGSRKMVEALIWPKGRDSMTSHQPLVEQPALFYKFADLGYSPTNSDILAFANRYGWLGQIESLVDPSTMMFEGNSPNARQNVISGEPIDQWFRQLNQYIPYLELWEAIVAGDQTYLASVIHWYDNVGSVSYGKQSVGSILIASMNNDRALFQTFAPGELLRPAKVVLTRVINQKLSDLCSPSLLFKHRSYTQSHLYFACKNLLGVIWLQFAKAVESNMEYRRCAHCSKPFIPNLGERGKKKKFCTDACKSKNYRAKLKQPRKTKPKVH